MLPNNWRYLRGDIYYADMESHIGSEQGGKRPVVVLQNNIGNRHSPTLIVATVTTRKMRAQKQFETLECPLHLDRLALPGRGTVLLEDLGNLVANELYSPGGAGKHTAEAVLAGLERLAAGCDHLIVVSNEVFSGGADYAGDTDQYLLALAQVNNAFAARADNVCRVVCGLPVYYKGGEKL